MTSPVFVEHSAALPLVTISIGFLTGSAADPPGKEGLARVAARMLRRGADGLTNEQIEDLVDRLGGELGIEAGPSSVSLSSEVISRNLEPFVGLVEKLLASSTLPEEEVGRVVREMQAEIVDSRDSDRSLASRALRRTLFAGHPYARRVSGSIDSLETITRADVVRWIETHLTRKNAVVAFSGDIDEARAREIAERILARLPEGRAFVDETPEPAGVRGRHLVLVDKPDRTQVQLVVGSLGSTPHDPDHVPWSVGNTAFGGTFTSRLMQEVRAKRGWSYGASSRIGYDRRRDAFTMWTAPSSTDAAACLALELGLVSEVKEGGLTEEEVGFVKNYLVRSHAFDVDTARKRVALPLEEALLGLPAGYHAGWLDRVRACQRAEINEALARRMPREDLVVAAVVTRADTGEALEKAMGDVASVTVLEPDFE
ncbi:MAG: insulinase family protein [Myxococcales bacterium]|nr:insulinase family protein [Myxococcales bacterium]